MSENAPPPSAVRIGDVEASDGTGCGMLGKGGSYEAALRKLRLRAQALRADFVHLISIREPYHDRQCAHRAFKLEGVAYRVGPSEPEPAPARSSAAPDIRSRKGTGFHVGQGGCTLRTPTTPGPASLTLTARLIAPAFTISIEPADPAQPLQAGTGAISLRYDRSSQKLELARAATGDVLARAAEPIHIDDAPHAWRIVQTPDELHVLYDGKKVLVAVFPSIAPEARFHIEPNQLEIVHISP